jgi:hypothetical protein
LVAIKIIAIIANDHTYETFYTLDETVYFACASMD